MVGSSSSNGVDESSGSVTSGNGGSLNVEGLARATGQRLASIKNEEESESSQFNCELIKSNKGGSKLLHEGYAYTKRYVRDERIRWECSQKVGMQCKGALTKLTIDTLKYL